MVVDSYQEDNKDDEVIHEVQCRRYTYRLNKGFPETQEPSALEPVCISNMRFGSKNELIDKLHHLDSFL